MYLCLCLCVCVCPHNINPSKPFCISLSSCPGSLRKWKKNSGWLCRSVYIMKKGSRQQQHLHIHFLLQLSHLPTRPQITQSSQHAGKVLANLSQFAKCCMLFQLVTCFTSFSACVHVLFVTIYIYVLPNKTVNPSTCYCDDCMAV